jgi:PhnB protein
MLKSTPFLLFDGNCAEAMTFYQDCLGGELSMTKLKETPMKDMLPVQKHERLINAHLKSGDFEISATDWMASPQYEPHPGDTTAIFVTSQSLDEIRSAFDKLTVGAEKEKFQALHELPIGVYGQFTDKFGVHWIFLNPKN